MVRGLGRKSSVVSFQWSVKHRRTGTFARPSLVATFARRWATCLDMRMRVPATHVLANVDTVLMRQHHITSRLA